MGFDLGDVPTWAGTVVASIAAAIATWNARSAKRQAIAADVSAREARKQTKLAESANETANLALRAAQEAANAAIASAEYSREANEIERSRDERARRERMSSAMAEASRLWLWGGKVRTVAFEERGEPKMLRSSILPWLFGKDIRQDEIEALGFEASFSSGRQAGFDRIAIVRIECAGFPHWQWRRIDDYGPPRLMWSKLERRFKYEVRGVFVNADGSFMTEAPDGFLEGDERSRISITLRYRDSNGQYWTRTDQYDPKPADEGEC
ncbi:hypothetical protein [Actinokineospora cianjurensis]|uniref:Uncharacterized protein n=1 Tax=Actinokineospora cianjurensis TaxID=585224 RepID=A0A421BAE8_9PSEU|nr:hypothetical protein [Actinokineospora cianjurensis]RLK61297.1 hypothetical protein CLV68_1834 [Actinokineospora cianjurensis]